MKKRDHGKRQPLLYVKVMDSYDSGYFLHLLLADQTTLRQLDMFLRDIWLECCGHMSAFSFARYGDELDMELPVADVLEIGATVQYQYDFGDTTELLVTAMGKYQGPAAKTIDILSRNAAPMIACDDCKSKPATIICTECSGPEHGWLCEDCAKTHDCDEEMYLPVVNSPRCGVCGYTG